MSAGLLRRKSELAGSMTATGASAQESPESIQRLKCYREATESDEIHMDSVVVQIIIKFSLESNWH